MPNNKKIRNPMPSPNPVIREASFVSKARRYDFKTIGMIIMFIIIAVLLFLLFIKKSGVETVYVQTEPVVDMKISPDSPYYQYYSSCVDNCDMRCMDDITMKQATEALDISLCDMVGRGMQNSCIFNVVIELAVHNNNPEECAILSPELKVICEQQYAARK